METRSYGGDRGDSAAASSEVGILDVATATPPVPPV
jgi:hypothetical protein